MARRVPLKNNVGQTLLNTKLQILRGTGSRRPSIALSILTGRVAEQLSILETFYAADRLIVRVQLPCANPFLDRRVFVIALLVPDGLADVCQRILRIHFCA